MALKSLLLHLLLLTFVCAIVPVQSFNEICFRTTTSRETARSTPIPQGSSPLLKLSSTRIANLQELTFKLYGVPLPDCGLDVYLLGSFYILPLALATIRVDCSTSSPGFSKPVITPIKTGIQQPMSSYPDVPTEWWMDFGTLVQMHLDKVNASIPGLYDCVGSYTVNATELSLSVTVQVNGCPYGYWGVDCSNVCQCQNGGTCHPWDGSCRCTEAWKGDICEIPNPHVKSTASNDKLFIGDTVTLRCDNYVIQPEDTDFRWLFNGTEIEKRSRTLTIPSITDNNAGFYTCEARFEDSDYNDTIQLDILGCRAGFHGEDCSSLCECKNNEFCDRFNGCQCSGNYSGPACELVACNDGVYRKTCEETDDGQDISADGTANPAVLGLSIGGGLLVLFTVGVFLVLHFLQPWKRIAVSFRSQVDEQYFRSKDVFDLVKDQWNCLSEDLGVVWSQWKMDASSLYIGERIGDGHFSWVYEGHVLKGSNIYHIAVKLLRDEKKSSAWKGFKNELKTLAHISAHPNIVQLVGVCSMSFLDQGMNCLVLEYLSLGSLYKLLHSNREPKECSVFLKPENYRDIVLGILQGMCRLEELRYVHRDLETRNILLTDKLVAKISDFGLARDSYSTGFYQTEEQVTKTLPWKWMAYESLKDNVYTNKSDVWSFGVLLWEISTLGSTPYPAVQNEDLLVYLNEGGRLGIPTGCSQLWYSAMTECWSVEPEERPCFSALKSYFVDLFSDEENYSPFAVNEELPIMTIRTEA